MNYDPRVDAYISKAAEYAKPILETLREIVHTACPDVEETIKWGMPAFEYHGPLCGMASFKAHCSFNFWKVSLMKNSEELLVSQSQSMGHLGRISSVKDLPSDKKLIAMIKDAAKLNLDGIKLPSAKSKGVVVPKTPADFKKALAANKVANKIFEDFAPSHRKEYILWIEEAKTDATRQKRLTQAIEWISEGKSRHWKYK